MPVGQKLQFKITRLEQGRGKNVNIVLSRRKLLEEANAEQAAVLRETLREGLVVKGRVVTIKDYGAFVDLGGLEGMLHISELSFQQWRRHQLSFRRKSILDITTFAWHGSCYCGSL